MHYELWQIASLGGVGLAAGVLGGLTGVGGSVIMIPAMAAVLPREGQHLYQAAAMIVNVVVAAPASLRHWIQKLVLKPMLPWLVSAATLGSVVGVAASNMDVFRGANCRYLARIFALFLFYVIAYNSWRLFRYREHLEAMSEEQSARLPRWKMTLVGMLMGFFGGLLGIGGGALAVPAQQIFLRIPLKNAIANSAWTMVFSAFVGAIYKNMTLMPRHEIPVSHSLLTAAVLAPSAFVGGYLGALLTYRLPRQPVRAIFLAVMIAGAWRMWTYK